MPPIPRPPSAAPTAASSALPLTDAQRRQLADELRDEAARLQRRLDRLREGDDGARTPDDDLAARHDAVAAALRRLADGAYGRCVACDAPIPFGRLLAMPEAAQCVGCGVAGFTGFANAAGSTRRGPGALAAPRPAA